LHHWPPAHLRLSAGSTCANDVDVGVVHCAFAGAAPEAAEQLKGLSAYAAAFAAEL